METNTKKHPFEAAGLGKAPYAFTGMHESRGPIKLADGSEIGAPGQPMGTCDYCGQGIAYICGVRASCGSEFVVGCDCVTKVWKTNKVETDGLRRKVNAWKREQQKAKEAVRIDAALALLTGEEGFRLYLRSVDASTTWATRSLLDSYEWLAKNAGHTGKVKLARRIEQSWENYTQR